MDRLSARRTTIIGTGEYIAVSRGFTEHRRTVAILSRPEAGRLVAELLGLLGLERPAGLVVGPEIAEPPAGPVKP